MWNMALNTHGSTRWTALAIANGRVRDKERLRLGGEMSAKGAFRMCARNECVQQ